MITKEKRLLVINYSIKVFLSLVLLIVCIFIWKSLSYSWFADNREVTANGVSVSVSTIPELKVRTDITVGENTTRVDVGDYMADGAVEGTDYYEVPLSFDLDTVSSRERILPGSSGSFTVYLEYTGGGTYTVNPRVSIKTERIAETGDSDQILDDSLRFANSHIEFTDINNNALTSIQINSNEETEFTVKWKWVKNYSDFSSGTINNSNYNDYLYGITDFDVADVTANTSAYNKADTFIALYMTPLYFHLEF